MVYINLYFHSFQIINKLGPDQIYEYISVLVGKAASQVTGDLVQYIFNNMREVPMFVGDYFSKIGISQGEYVLCVACLKNRADKLVIAQMYKLHLAIL